jgi:cytochrome P450
MRPVDVINYTPLSLAALFRFVRDVKGEGGSPQALKNLVGDRDYPDALAFRFGIKNFHYIMNPEWFGDIFKNADTFAKPPSVIKYVSLHGKTGIFTSNGEVWQKQRSILKPHFMRAALAGHEESVRLETQAMLSKWGADRGIKDLYEDLRDFSLRILFRTVFKYDATDHLKDLKESIDVLNGFLFKSLLNPLTFLFKLYFPPSKDIAAAKNMLDMVVNEVCASSYGAFREGVLASEILNAAGYYDAKTDAEREGAKMQAFDEIWQIISAGYEATASSLTWAVAELAQRPEYQERLRHEINLTVGHEALTFANTGKLKDQTRYLSEVLRVCPTLHTTVPRKAAQDAIIGGGYKIHQGDIVVVPLINVQQDPRWFKNPETLDPDRKDENVPKYADMPFLIGPHVCIGKAMFMQQAMSAITETLRNGEITLADGLPKKLYKTTIVPSQNCGLVYKPKAS